MFLFQLITGTNSCSLQNFQCCHHGSPRICIFHHKLYQQTIRRSGKLSTFFLNKILDQYSQQLKLKLQILMARMNL